ncbi:MAG: hypothetical protein PHC62_00720 [Candidatus Izemoplasmatales bacterium]|nr:hypothetical protein [Candidatus Izemoplasmatales bacterium]
MYYYDSRPLNEDLNMRIQRKNAQEFEEREKGRVFAESLTNKREDFLREENRFSNFLEQVKESLLVEAMYGLLEDALSENVTDIQKKQAKSIIVNFVKEEGSDRLIKKYATQTELLANLTGLVTSAFDKVVSETTQSSTDYLVKNSTTNEFYGKLREMKVGKMTNTIRDNVAKEMEKFITQQVEDKNRIEDLANETKEKLDTVKNKNATVKEEIKQEMANDYKVAVDNIRLRRPRSIFEEMVYNVSEKSVKDKELLETCFLGEDNKLDINKVVESVSVMYTMLEGMSVFKFKKFDAETIKTIVDNI